jgi:hypothetical protein
MTREFDDPARILNPGVIFDRPAVPEAATA